MSITDTIKGVLGLEDDDVEFTTFECQECGHTFESAKRPERATCMECLSSEVEPVGGSQP